MSRVKSSEVLNDASGGRPNDGQAYRNLCPCKNKEAPNHKAFRVRLADRKVEIIGSLKDLRQAAGPDGNTQISAAPDGSPFSRVTLGNQEIYGFAIKSP